VPATCLAQCLRDQDTAFRNFHARRARYPRFKRKSTSGNLRFQDVGQTWARGIVKVAKLGTLKLAEVLPEVVRPDMLTLRRDPAGRYP
jgi:putative transposase